MGKYLHHFVANLSEGNKVKRQEHTKLKPEQRMGVTKTNFLFRGIVAYEFINTSTVLFITEK